MCKDILILSELRQEKNNTKPGAYPRGGDDGAGGGIYKQQSQWQHSAEGHTHNAFDFLHLTCVLEPFDGNIDPTSDYLTRNHYPPSPL